MAEVSDCSNVGKAVVVAVVVVVVVELGIGAGICAAKVVLVRV
jgi:hypothetical protein